jgi:hypothetical protein
MWDFEEPLSSNHSQCLPLYYAAHRFFLEELKTLYIILFNMVNFSTWQLDYWIGSVIELAPHSSIILVGTHQDLITNNKLGQIQGFITTRYKSKFPNIVGFLPISCKSTKNLNKLKKLITFCASRALALRLKQETDTAQSKQHMQLEEQLEALATTQFKSDLIPLSEFTQIVNKLGICRYISSKQPHSHSHPHHFSFSFSLLLSVWSFN